MSNQNNVDQASKAYLDKLRRGSQIASSNTTAQTYSQNDTDRALELFARFRGTYGRLFSKQLDTEMDMKSSIVVWSEQLSLIDDDALALGISKLRAAYPVFPPSAFQFYDLCVPPTVKASHKPFPVLLEAPRNKSLARSSLAGVRRLLQGEVSHG